jgi:hypothetical protein
MCISLLGLFILDRRFYDTHGIEDWMHPRNRINLVASETATGSAAPQAPMRPHVE